MATFLDRVKSAGKYGKAGLAVAKSLPGTGQAVSSLQKSMNRNGTNVRTPQGALLVAATAVLMAAARLPNGKAAVLSYLQRLTAKIRAIK